LGQFRDNPLHLAGLDFILGDAARLTGVRVDHGWGSALELASAARRHQNVPVIAVETVHQLHGFLSPELDRAVQAALKIYCPPETGVVTNDARMGLTRSRTLCSLCRSAIWRFLDSPVEGVFPERRNLSASTIALSASTESSRRSLIRI